MVQKYEFVQGLNTSTFLFEAENMDKRWSAVFRLTLVLFVFGTLAFAQPPTDEPITIGDPTDGPSENHQDEPITISDPADRLLANKAGRCPNSFGGLFSKICFSNNDCGWAEKCCPSFIGRRCMDEV